MALVKLERRSQCQEKDRRKEKLKGPNRQYVVVTNNSAQYFDYF